MHLIRPFSDGEIVIIMSHAQGFGLGGTCFRGKHHAVAGNFKRWDLARQVLSDAVVLRPFSCRCGRGRDRRARKRRDRLLCAGRLEQHRQARRLPIGRGSLGCGD
jgi:hypothetical protein